MVTTTSLVSSLQRKSTKTLWRHYDLNSDGSIVTIGGDLSLAIGDAEHNASFRHHLDMVKGVKSDVLQALIGEFEAEREALEAMLSFFPADDPTAHVALSTDVPSTTSFPEQATDTCEGPSPFSITATSTQTSSTNRPTKRSRVRDDGNGKVKCPGNKGQGECSKDSKKRWGQIHKFDEHFKDEHMSSYKEKDVGYRCDCGQTFIKKESGKAAFAKHVRDIPHTEE